jgi:hypothetical protein
MIAMPVFPKSFRTARDSFAFWVIYRDLSSFQPGRSPWYTVMHWPAVLVSGGRGRVPDPTALYAGPSLNDARCAVPETAETCLLRCPDDDPSVVETWI